MARAAFVLAGLSVATLFLACGKKGPPLPPASRGPHPVATIEVRQHGDRIEVSFVMPEARAPGAASTISRAELVRVTYAPGGAPPPDADAFRRRGEVVEVRAATVEPRTTMQLVDPPPHGGASAPGTTLRYGVRLYDQRNRTSTLAVAPDLVLAEPPAAPAGLHGEPTADGVRLAWEGAKDARYNVYRWSEGSTAPQRPLNERPLAVTEYLDASASPGSRLVYTVRAIFVEPPPYIESADATPITIDVVDTFSPAPPSGLVAVQEGLAVRLFWDPGAERDLAGYRVYRREGADGDWVRIGPDPVDRPLFLDDTISAGQTISYRVTAIDRATPSNESVPSDAVEIATSAEPAPTREEER
jgi:hypothetical protein